MAHTRMPAVLLLVTLTSTAVVAADDVLCDHPADSLPLASEVRRIHAAFDAASERRIFSEVHYYRPGDPHLTVGMGHWTYGNLIELFKRLHASSDVWHEVLERWYSVLTPQMWAEFATDTGVSGHTAESLGRGLQHLLCITTDGSCETRVLRPWTHRRGEAFNRDTNWFRAGWRQVARLRRVGEIQVQLWLDTVVLPAEADAQRVGAPSLGGVASLASARSSSSSIARTVAAKVNSTRQVPSSARPVDASKQDDARLLSDWKAVVAWNEYNVTKREIRPRMQAIWRAYFEQTWGRLPRVAGELQSLKHTGCYMATRPMERAIQLDIPSPQACTTGVPVATPAGCSR